MADYTVKRFDEMEAVMGGGFLRARSSLGVSSFGMQVVSLPANFEHYPEHDHTHDGQEEVYVVIGGGGQLVVDGEPIDLEPDMAVRVGAAAKRKLLPGGEGLKLITLGGMPGKPYTAPDFTNVGGREPGAR